MRYLLVFLLAGCGAYENRDCYLNGEECRDDVEESQTVVVKETKTVVVKQGPKGDKGDRGEDGETVIGPVGPQGMPGLPGEVPEPNPYDIEFLFDPCGDDPNEIDEVLMVTYSGLVIASFSDSPNGKNTRFVVLPDGDYQTTDGSDCEFNIPEDVYVE